MDGNGKIISLLERIALGVEDNSRRIDETNERLDAMRGELRTEMRDGFAAVNTRLDNALAFMGRYHSDHEKRIHALEERVFKKSGS